MASFQRTSAFRNAFENAKVAKSAIGSRLTDSLVSALFRHVGMVREQDNFKLSFKTTQKLKEQGILA